MSGPEESQASHADGGAPRPGVGPAVWLPGPRAAEGWLARALAADVAEAGADAGLARLARPLRIVVPSRSLRRHLCARLVALHGRPALGVEVATLHTLATAVLARAGVPAPATGLVPVLVRRAARAEPALAAGLESLVDGYGAVVAAVDDLLDAGLEPPHTEPLLERIDAASLGEEGASRARALVRVAHAVAMLPPTERVAHRAALYRLAREQLERDPNDALPARGIWIHGFADATGVQADLLETLARHPAARVLLDAPPDVDHAAAVRPARRFGRAFVERIEALGPADESRIASPAPPRPGLLRAPAHGSEVRAVAERVRAALDDGVAPERIAIVARDLGLYRTALRRHLARLAIPFSGVAERGGATAARRRLDALQRLLDAGAAAPAEGWLDALERIHGADGRRRALSPERRAELRHALHGRGALRLAQVASRVPPDVDVQLDAREGLRTDARGVVRAVRRHLPKEALAAAARSARAAVRRLAARPGPAPLDAHRAWLRGLVDDLGWVAPRPGAPPEAARATPGWEELTAALDGLDVPAGFALDGEEFAWLLRRALERAGFAPLGGAGGGVQVLSVMEARAQAFERLFVLGLSRGAFPRSISEDPLLPDGLRLRMRDVLPDLPVKREGFDEERFLFAQLLASADAVVLSHPEKDDTGRPLPRSPLLEPLARVGALDAEEVAPALHAAPLARPLGDADAPLATAGAVPRRIATAGELALWAGLHGSSTGFAGALRAALPASQGGTAQEALLRARVAVVRELEARRDPPGPYHGLVGGLRPGDVPDPRRADLYVTTLEALARCPWQTFLRRVLGLAPVPDALALPGGVDALLLGNTVHRVLERIAGEAGNRPADLEARRDTAPDLEALRDAAPRRPEWPEPARLDEMLLEEARRALEEAALAVPGYEQLLVLQAHPCLEEARRLDWADGPPAVLGCEVGGAARVATPAGERVVHFRADRVDRVVDGGAARLRLTDFKTGSPVSDKVRPESRRADLEKAIRKGRLLQAGAYVRAAGAGSEGRYVYLRPGLREDARTARVEDAGPASEAFDAVARVLLAVWETGAFVPRLREAEEDNEPRACQGCEVKEACVRGDSGARQRLSRLLEEEAPPEAPALRAAWDVLRLGAGA